MMKLCPTNGQLSALFTKAVISSLHFPYSLKKPSHFHWFHMWLKTLVPSCPYSTPQSYSVVVWLHPVGMFLWGRTTSARVSLSNTYLNAFFFSFFLLHPCPEKTLTLKALFLCPFVWCCRALQLLPHLFHILLHLARCYFCLFNCWSVCVVWTFEIAALFPIFLVIFPFKCMACVSPF